MLRELYIYPHPVLRQVAKPVQNFDQTLKTLIQDMQETMLRGQGVGLAAPQVGESLQVFIIDCSQPSEPSALHVYINPEILKREEPILWNEGCLSLPGLYRDVKTFNKVSVRAQNLEGEYFTQDLEGLHAVAVLHEYGHLQGELFIDRLSPVKRSLVKKFWAKNARNLAEKTYKDSGIVCRFAD